MAFVRKDWLNGETASVTTDPEEVPGASQYGLQVSHTGSPSAGIVLLQGSIDGVNWSTLAGFNAANNPSGFISWAAADRPVVFLRLDLSSISGGTAPTFTASVIAV